MALTKRGLVYLSLMTGVILCGCGQQDHVSGAPASSAETNPSTSIVTTVFESTDQFPSSVKAPLQSAAPTASSTASEESDHVTSADGRITVGWVPDGFVVGDFQLSKSPAESGDGFGRSSITFVESDTGRSARIGIEYGTGSALKLATTAENPEPPHIMSGDIVPGADVYVWDEVPPFSERTAAWAASDDVTVWLYTIHLDSDVIARLAQSVTVAP